MEGKKDIEGLIAAGIDAVRTVLNRPKNLEKGPYAGDEFAMYDDACIEMTELRNELQAPVIGKAIDYEATMYEAADASAYLFMIIQSCAEKLGRKPDPAKARPLTTTVIRAWLQNIAHEIHYAKTMANIDGRDSLARKLEHVRLVALEHETELFNIGQADIVPAVEESAERSRLIAALDLANIQLSQVEKAYRNDNEFVDTLEEVRRTLEAARRNGGK